MFHTLYKKSKYLVDNKSKRLGNCQNKTCRFCDRWEPEVTFHKSAHLLPQSTGNRSLLACYECDECNQKFGHKYEDDFGKYTKTYRTLLGISGRSGIPAVKYQLNGSEARLKANRKSETSVHFEAQGILTSENLDLEKKAISYQVAIEPYVPWNVLRCLYHSSYLALNASDLPKFSQLKSWIKDADVYPGKLDAMNIYRSLGNVSRRKVMPFIELYDRTRDIDLYSKCILIGFSSLLFQLYLPSDDDLALIAVGSQFARPVYEWPSQETSTLFGEVRFDEVDLSQTSVQKGNSDEVKVPLPDSEWNRLRGTLIGEGVPPTELLHN